MKILIVTAHFPPTRGGMADYSARLCEELSKRGHAVRVIASAASIANAKDSSVKIDGLGSPWNLSSYFRLKKQIIHNCPDAILVLYTPSAFNRRGPGIPIALLLLAIRCTLKVPIFIYAHELYAHWSQSYLRAPWYIAQRVAIVILISISEKFQVLTEARRTRLADIFPFWKRKLGMIPCPPTLDTQIVDPDWRANNQIDKGIVLISTMSLDHPEKGTRLLASLADGLSNEGLKFRYVTIGGLRVDHPKIESWGYVSAHDAWNLLAASDLFVAPYSDGISGRRSTAQNALALGTPVLSTSGPNTDPNIFPEEALAMVPEKDESAFVQKAIDLLNDPVELSRLRVCGKKLGEVVFSWDTHIRKWETLLKGGQSSGSI